MPSTNRRALAVLECCQEIPCNPCVTACKTGAITKGSLNSLPVFHPEKCVGCKRCAAACPGQAIFLVEDLDEGRAAVTFPYEYCPLPHVGQEVTATDRMGRAVCPGRVLAVACQEEYHKTALVTLEIPAQFRDVVRFLRRPEREER